MVEKAVTAAGRGDSRGFGAAKAEVEAARKGLADGLAALRVSAATQTAAIDAASAQCVARPELANYAACLALPAQQTIVAATVEGLTSRYQAAEAAYAADRARLDEAAAAVALGGLR